MKRKLSLPKLSGQLGVGLCLVGLLLVFLGWNGAASRDRVPAQFPYLLSGGIAGLSLVLLGGIGCGGEPTLTPVRGTVSYQGSPLKGGIIVFTPDAEWTSMQPAS